MILKFIIAKFDGSIELSLLNISFHTRVEHEGV